MRILTMKSLLLAGLTLGAFAARADDQNPRYKGASKTSDYYYAGVNLWFGVAPEQHINRPSNGLNLFAESNLGVIPGLHVGRQMGDWRFFLDYDHRYYQYSDIELRNPGSLSLLPGDNLAGDGQQKSQSLMANVGYNLFAGEGWQITPSFGLGVAHVDINQLSVDGIEIVNDDNYALAAQVAVEYIGDLNDDWQASIGYRYWTALETDFRTADGTEDISFGSHEFGVRLSYKFGQSKAPAPKLKMKSPPPAPRPTPVPKPVVKEMPKPAPKPAPRPIPAPKVVEPPRPAAPKASDGPIAAPKLRPVVIYFDHDSSSLNDDAKTRVARAFKRWQQGAAPDLTIAGHADSSGSVDYNNAISLKRANRVRDALIALGVPADQISTESYGESNPEVATGDGVREPANRRAVITLKRK